MQGIFSKGSRIILVRLGMILLLPALAQGCSPKSVYLSASANNPAADQAETVSPTQTPFLPQSPKFSFPMKAFSWAVTPSPTPTPTPAPREWYEYPVVPEVGDRARALYSYGLSLGNNPVAFSVIGDCEAIPSLFLGVFDTSPSNYHLGDYVYLQETIDRFAGNFGRISRAAHDSFTTSSVLSPLWAHPAYCNSGETPLDCELRIHQPSIALVVVGTMDYVNPPRFEPQMRIILDTLIQHGTVPILYTKASNWEGDWSINAAVGRLAYEYDVPLWNFWRAVQPLPNHGLRADGLHLSWWYNYFDDPYAMRYGWPWRNLTALQAIDAVWRGVELPIEISASPTPASE